MEFAGFGNVEVVPIEHLSQSLGEEARQLQIMAVAGAAVSDGQNGDDASEVPQVAEISHVLQVQEVSHVDQVANGKHVLQEVSDGYHKPKVEVASKATQVEEAPVTQPSPVPEPAATLPTRKLSLGDEGRVVDKGSVERFSELASCHSATVENVGNGKKVLHLLLNYSSCCRRTLPKVASVHYITYLRNFESKLTR